MDEVRGLSDDGILEAFERRTDRNEPLTTTEVADATGCARRTAYNRLEALADEGELRTKKVGACARVWWRPPAARTAVGRASTSDGETDETDARNGDTRNSDLLDRILETSPVGIVVVEPSGTISLANGRAEDMLGLTRDEITSRTYTQPEWHITYDDGTPIRPDEHPVTRVLVTGKPVYGFEHWLELPDGTERWLSSNSAPVFDAEGEVDCVVVGLEDATALKRREEKLTSEHVRSLTLTSRRVVPSGFDAADREIRVTVDSVVGRPDGSALQYVTIVGLPAKSAVDVLEQHDRVRSVRLLSSVDDRCRVEMHTDSDTVPIAFDGLGGRVKAIVLDGDAVRFLGELPGDVDPRDAVAAARRIYPDVELLSEEFVYSPRLLYDIVEDALTDRQFAALQAAYYGGYFDIPRASTGDVLADRIGVTRQTFNQHLRKAERIVFSRLFEKSGDEAR